MFALGVYFTIMELNLSSQDLITLTSVKLVPLHCATVLIPYGYFPPCSSIYCCLRTFVMCLPFPEARGVTVASAMAKMSKSRVPTVGQSHVRAR